MSSIRFCCMTLLVLAGCKKGDSFAVVHVSSVVTLPAVSVLRVRGDFGGAQTHFDVGAGTDAGPTFAIPPMHVFGLQLPSSLAGTLMLHVDAYDDSATLLLGGDGQVDINPGQRRDVDVVLGGAQQDLSDVDGAEDMGGPVLTLSPPSFLYPQVDEGTTGATATFVLKNAGTSTTEFIAAPAIGGADQISFKIVTENCQGVQLAPQATCSVTVQFLPKSAGKIVGTLIVSGTASALNGTALGTWNIDTGSQFDLNAGTFSYSAVWGADAANIWAASSIGVWRRTTSGWGRTYPSTFPIKAVWGTSASDVYAVGGGPTLIHYEGFGWSDFKTGVDPSNHHACAAIVGATKTDLYTGCDGITNGVMRAAGTTTWIDEPNSTNFSSALWVDPTTGDIYSINSTNVVRKRGGAWGGFYTASAALHALWGTSATDIYVAGDGIVLHYDAAGWSQPAANVPNVSYRGLWGTSKDDLFLVGDGGTILHSTGGNVWVPHASNTTQNLNGVWGSASGDVYVVGDSGTVLHYK